MMLRPTRFWLMVAMALPISASCLASSDNSPAHSVTHHPSATGASAAHWAFQPLGKFAPPSVQSDWVRTSIDQFVLAELNKAGLTPAPAADRRTLFRRLSYDLLGMPPTYAESEAFATETAADVIDRAVDQMLARHEFGQRWARHWLDVARYADTTGYIEGGEERYPFAYTYRDYVVRSFNEDTPVNRFIVEQLAADQLELAEPDQWKLAAMAFLTVGPRFNYNRHEIIDDRIDVLSRGLVGLTAACARCHDHKFDPISTRDYYSLYGILASSVEPLYTDLPRIGPSGGTFRDYRRFRETVTKRTQSLEQFHAATHRNIQHEMRSLAGEYLWYIVQLMPEHRTEEQISFKTKRGLIRGPTPYGPGGIVRWQHYIESRGDDDPVFGLWNRLAKSSRNEFVQQMANAVSELRMNERLRDSISERPPANMVELARRYGELLEQAYSKWQSVRERDHAASELPDAATEQLRQVLFGADSPVAMNEYEAHDCYTDGEFNRYMGLKRELEAVFVANLSVAEPRAMVLVNRDEPYTARVFDRGNANRPTEFAPRQLPGILAASEQVVFGSTSGRLELAIAITRSDTERPPLAARVYVNRVWTHLFGEGLVRTPSDFGTRGEPPTHPELLDYLTEWFIQQGWSTKELIRLIVRSAVYQQESVIDLPDSDPDNRLLSGMNRRRVDFESLRDALLAVSGRLDTRVGGPPTGDFASPRRSIYLVINRNRTPAVFGTFDFPNPDISNPQRPETIVPQQALYLMNSPFVSEVVDAIARELDAQHGDREDIEARIRWLYSRCFGREPSPAELQVGATYLTQDSAFTFDRAEDERAHPDSDVSWQLYIQSLLMLNEFVYID